MEPKLLGLRASTETSRQEKFNGKDHLVVPVVALVEGVLHPANAPAPELALASEFGKHFQGWNGRPVVVNHPQLKGQLVSANIPEVLESEQIGQVFNTSVDGEKLRMEAWIDLEKAKELGGIISETIDRVSSGDEVVEISTGLFAETEIKEGKFNEEKFSGIWRHITPDHLAILTEDKVGACSIEDGCGTPRVNSLGCGPGCKCGGACMTNIDARSNGDNAGAIEKAIGKALSKFGFGPKASTEAKEFKKQFDDGLITFKKHTHRKRSDRDVRSALQAALEAKDNPFAFVVAVFDGSFVFEDVINGGLFEQSFDIAEDGTVNLGEELIQVRPETDFVPVKTNEESDMNKDELVKGLIANGATNFAEDDEEWLMTLEEETLQKLSPKEPPEPEPAPASATPPGEGENKTPTPGDGDGENKAPVKEPTAEEYIDNAPEEIRDVLNEGLTMQRSKRDDLVKGLLAHGDNKFSEDDLKAMSTKALANLASLAHTETDYTGRGGPRVQEDKSKIPPAPKVFEQAQAS